MLGTQLFSSEWNKECFKFHITIGELFPIVLAIQLWGGLLRKKCVQFHTDKIAVVYIINKQSSKDPTVMIL